jgi:hypothetical protein
VPYGYNEGQPVSELECDAVVASLLDAAGRIAAAGAAVVRGDDRML